MIIERYIKQDIINTLNLGKVAIVYGSRQTGKTTLAQLITNELKTLNPQTNVLKIDGDRSIHQQAFSSQNLVQIKQAIGDANVLVFDEAQRIENIGINLKIIHDNIKDVAIIATGSSSFELANKINEPLTGRSVVFTLYPVSILELNNDNLHIKESLSSYLIYGMYPEVLTSNSYTENKTYLTNYVSSTLFKDILELKGVKNPKLFQDLLTLLAYQIGKEVSLSELASSLEVTKETVKRYLDLLEKIFIIKNIRGFSRNLRKEVTKTSRYYFYDNGVRNAIINNFNPLKMRNDKGMLWENFLVMERLKKQEYKKIYANNYFWRTWDKKEVDFVEERDGKLYGFEFKWGKEKSKGKKYFEETYKEGKVEIITQDNYLNFIT